MTLARQMYPSQPQELIRQFDEAVSQKFGYLLLDLKPTTPTGMRMRTDVFSIKGADKNANVQCLEDFQAAQNTSKIGESKLGSTENNKISDLINTTEQNQTQFTMPSCDDCGVVFENHHDLQSHVKNWCPQQMSLKRLAPEVEEDVFRKRYRYDDENDDMDSGSNYDSDLENDAFGQMVKLVRARKEDEWSRKVDKYEQEGLGTREAEQKANKKLQDVDMRQFLQIYGTL